MAKKARWFLLGAFGTVVGVGVKLVRGRRQEAEELERWERAAAAAEEESRA